MAKRWELNYEELERDYTAKVKYLEKEVGELHEDDTVMDEGTFDSFVNEVTTEEVKRFIDEDLPFWLRPIVKYFARYYY